MSSRLPPPRPVLASSSSEAIISDPISSSSCSSSTEVSPLPEHRLAPVEIVPSYWEDRAAILEISWDDLLFPKVKVI